MTLLHGVSSLFYCKSTAETTLNQPRLCFPHILPTSQATTIIRLIDTVICVVDRESSNKPTDHVVWLYLSFGASENLIKFMYYTVDVTFAIYTLSFPCIS
jgi:hypothetical protein